MIQERTKCPYCNRRKLANRLNAKTCCAKRCMKAHGRSLSKAHYRTRRAEMEMALQELAELKTKLKEA